MIQQASEGNLVCLYTRIQVITCMIIYLCLMTQMLEYACLAEIADTELILELPSHVS